MTMNRNDSHQNATINIKITGKIADTPTFSLASVCKLFLQDDARVNHLTNGRNTKTGEEIREDSLRPSKRMQLRILGMKRRAASHTPADDYRYQTVYPRKMISLEKKHERVNGLKSHAFPPSPRYTMDACYRTVHPKKAIALEKMHDRVHGLENHSAHGLQTEDLFHRAVHPNMMTMNGNEAVSRNYLLGAAKRKRMQLELFKQEDMIKTQGQGLQKKYQLIHSDLGKLLRSTPMGSPCSSASGSPTRFASSSA